VSISAHVVIFSYIKSLGSRPEDHTPKEANFIYPLLGIGKRPLSCNIHPRVQILPCLSDIMRLGHDTTSVPNQFYLLFLATASLILHNTSIKSMATILLLTIIHGIADLVSMLFRRSDETQQTDWNFGKSATGRGDDVQNI